MQKALILWTIIEAPAAIIYTLQLFFPLCADSAHWAFSNLQLYAGGKGCLSISKLCFVVIFKGKDAESTVCLSICKEGKVKLIAKLELEQNLGK